MDEVDGKHVKTMGYFCCESNKTWIIYQAIFTSGDSSKSN